MREIQFRGKANDRWYYGHYLKTDDVTYCMASDAQEEDNTHHFILFDRMTDWGLPNNHYKVEVNGDTVGEWSGVYDKNHKPIYEGDIVKKRGKDGSFHMMPVRFNNGRFECWYKPENHWVMCDYSYSLVDSSIEIVGNIYDNPELVSK